METTMRAFETVRSIYQVMYAVIWVLALLMIVGSVASQYLGDTEKLPLTTLVGGIVLVIVSAMVLSWLVLLTICAIDSRNFLADIHKFQLDRLAQSTKPNRPHSDRYDRPI